MNSEDQNTPQSSQSLDKMGSLEKKLELQERINLIFNYIQQGDFVRLGKYLSTEETQSLDLNTYHLNKNSGYDITANYFLDFALDQFAEHASNYPYPILQDDKQIQTIAALINAGARFSPERLEYILTTGFFSPKDGELTRGVSGIKDSKRVSNYGPGVFKTMMKILDACGINWYSPLYPSNGIIKGEYLVEMLDKVFTRFSESEDLKNKKELSPGQYNAWHAEKIKKQNGNPQAEIEEDVIQFLNDFGLPEFQENYRHFLQKKLEANKQNQEDILKFSNPLDLLLKRRATQRYSRETTQSEPAPKNSL